MQKSTKNRALFPRTPIFKLLIFMKMVFSMILLSFLCVSAKVNSQDLRLSLRLNNVPISEVVKAIEKKSSFKFVINHDLFDADTRVSVGAEMMPLKDILNKVLNGTGFSYKLLDDLIIITKEHRGVLTGIVLDEKEAPMPGVTVYAKEYPQTVTVTDKNGHFSLSLPKDVRTLLFSFIGYKTYEHTVVNINGIKITMSPETGNLDEIQVIGYGTTTRRLSTGSISSVTAKDLANQPVQNPLNALQGRIAGAQISGGNLPGSNVNILIRGQNSINSGTIPLYIVDGVPFNVNDGSYPAGNSLNSNGPSGANGSVSPFSVINALDIERIDVLKDADATAIYGARGGNGVVLITTKKGQSGKMKVNANFYQGVGKVSRFADLLDPEEYYALRREAIANDGLVASASNAPDLVSWGTANNTDWQEKYQGGSAELTDAQLSLSGGNNNTRFLFSNGFHSETTIFPGDFRDSRISSRLNLDHSTNDKRFNMNLSVNYSYDQSKLPSSDVSSSASLPPNFPLYNPDGTLFWFGTTFTNPESSLMQTYSSKTNSLIVNSTFGYEVLPGLTVKTSVGYTNLSFDNTQALPIASKNPNVATPTNSAVFGDNNNASYIIEPQINYRRRIAKGNLTVLVGSTFQRSAYRSDRITADGFSNPNLLSTPAGASTYTVGSEATLYKYNSLFGRVNYEWDEKYLISANLRRDGSSRFGSDNAFGTFYSLAGSWIFSQENFIKDNLKVLSFGKLKASYGLTGNDQIQEYMYLSTFTPYSGSYSYQGIGTLSPSGVNNTGIQWETNRKLDLAIDLGFFNNRLLLTADYYRNRSDNQLGYITLPAQSGTNAYTGNIPALLENSGFEFELNTTNIKGKSFQWRTSLNLTIPSNKLIEVSPSYFYAATLRLGYPINQTLNYEFAGVNPANGAPSYINAAGQTVATPVFATDRTVVFSANPPEFYGGIGNDFSYKGFSLSFFLQFTKGEGAVFPSAAPGVLGNGNVSSYWLDRWRSPGDVSNLPRATTTASIYSFLGTSSYRFGDVSSIQLNNVALSYTFNNEWVKKAKLSGLRIFMQGQNIYRWSKYQFGNGPQRVITAGLNLSF